MIDTLLLNTFSSLVDTSLLPISSSPNYSSIQCTNFPFTLTPFTIPTASFHLTSHHYTSPHFTSLHFTSPHITKLHLTIHHFTALLNNFGHISISFISEGLFDLTVYGTVPPPNSPPRINHNVIITIINIIIGLTT